MKKYTLEEVVDSKREREFLNLPKRIYKGNRNWVCPLDNDILKVFNPQKNHLFNNGEAIRWIAVDSEGKVVGRIAAFYNRELAAANELPTGGCGFFECENEPEIANMLFDASKEWLISHGLEAMDGPINFGDRADWWGLLVNGYEFQPLYANSYNPPYYKELFENYGFQNFFNQHSYFKNIKAGDLNQSVYDKAKRLESLPGYRIEHISKKNLDKVTEDFRFVYNKAWALFTGVKPIDSDQAKSLMKKLKPIIDERLMHFAFFNDEPIGFFIMAPDLNRAIGAYNGKLNWFNKLRLMYNLKFTNKLDRVFGIIFAVIPEFRGKGIEAGLMCSFEKEMAKESLKYKTLELAWVGDFNPVMMRMVESYVCAKRHKMHTTYRLLFDPTREFKRSPRMGLKNSATKTQ